MSLLPPLPNTDFRRGKQGDVGDVGTWGTGGTASHRLAAEEPADLWKTATIPEGTASGGGQLPLQRQIPS